jgi:hypothetical protein
MLTRAVIFRIERGPELTEFGLIGDRETNRLNGPLEQKKEAVALVDFPAVESGQKVTRDTIVTGQEVGRGRVADSLDQLRARDEVAQQDGADGGIRGPVRWKHVCRSYGPRLRTGEIGLVPQDVGRCAMTTESPLTSSHGLMASITIFSIAVNFRPHRLNAGAQPRKSTHDGSRLPNGVVARVRCSSLLGSSFDHFTCRLPLPRSLRCRPPPSSLYRPSGRRTQWSRLDTLENLSELSSRGPTAV